MREAADSRSPKIQLALTNFPEAIICFSHLRWDFVYQRPQHILSRMALTTPVYFIEEPIHWNGAMEYKISKKDDHLSVLTPMIPEGQDLSIVDAQHQLLSLLIHELDLKRIAFWYYTPMALKFSQQFDPGLVIYDCMDELSNFKFAPPEIKQLEQKLILQSDLVFTGGASLYQAKKHQHHNIYQYSSSIDATHFGKARNGNRDPEDQQAIAHSRVGFFGVIDERFDIELIRELAEKRTDWNFVLLARLSKSTLQRSLSCLTFIILAAVPTTFYPITFPVGILP